MTNGERAPVTAIFMDAAQAESVKEDLSASIALGAKSIILVCNPNPKEEPAGRQIRVGESVGTAKVPMPEVGMVGAVYVIGTENDLEDILPHG